MDKKTELTLDRLKYVQKCAEEQAVAGQPIDEPACLEKFQQARHDWEKLRFQVNAGKASPEVLSNIQKQFCTAESPYHPANLADALKEQGYFTLSGQEACGMLEEHFSRQGLPAKPDSQRSR
jgi:hypothetical protein